MNKSNNLKLFEHSCIEGITKFKKIKNAIDEFLSDNFYSGVPKLNYFHKFFIKKKKIIQKKKKQNHEQIKRDKNIFGVLMKNKRQINLRKRHINKSQKEINSLSKDINKNNYKTFERNLSNLSSNPINLFNKPNRNKLLLLSQDNSQDFSFNYPKSPTNRVNNKYSFLQLNKGNLKRVNSTRLLQTPKNNLKKFSISNFFANKFNSYDKSTYPQSPNSTLIKSRLKNVSIKSDNDNDIDNDFTSNEKNRNKMKKIKSAFSLKLSDENNNEYDNNNKDKSTLFDDLLLSSNTKFSFNDRKKLHQKIKLKNLLANMENAKRNNVFKPNEKTIKSNLNYFKTFKLRAKSASLLKKYISQKNKYTRLSKNNKYQQIPHQNIVDGKSKRLLNTLQKVLIYAKKGRRNIKINDKKYDTNKLKFFLNNLGIEKDFDKRVDEQFKKDAVKYQEKIGKFFIHNGNGIFSGHINVLLRGEKIASNKVKFDCL